jgi:superfamily I DNA/RNA helicase
MTFNPTEYQKKVISHHLGHARVLAIAGSGKTTTMVYRIKKLIEEREVNPKKIRVLMFNTAASDDFKKKSREILNGGLPYISTFHSFVQKTGIVYHPQRIKVSIVRRVKVNHLERVKMNH